MTPTFTLDTNCLIAVDEERMDAVPIRQLLAAHRAGTADCALVASGAAEMQKDRAFLTDMADFDMRRTSLGFGDLSVLHPIARWGMSFWGHGFWSSEEGAAREQSIFEAMFPNSYYSWEEFARSRSLDPEDRSPENTSRWRNKILDAQAFWAHENANREFFVTTDNEFRRLEAKGYALKGTIVSPSEAAQKLT